MLHSKTIFKRMLGPDNSPQGYLRSGAGMVWVAIQGFTNTIFRKYLMENCSSELYPQLSFKKFLNSCSVPKLFSKVQTSLLKVNCHQEHAGMVWVAIQGLMRLDQTHQAMDCNRRGAGSEHKCNTWSETAKPNQCWNGLQSAQAIRTGCAQQALFQCEISFVPGWEKSYVTACQFPILFVRFTGFK